MARVAQSAVTRIAFMLGACCESLTALGLGPDHPAAKRLDAVRATLEEASKLLCKEEDPKEATTSWRPTK